MRIAIDAHMVGTHETGNEVYITNVIRALQRINSADHDFLILRTPHSRNPLDPSFVTPQFQLSSPLPDNPLIRIPWSIPRLATKDRVDVLCMTYNAPLLLRDVASVVLVHDLGFKQFPQYYSARVRWILSLLVPLSIRNARCVVVLSDYIKQQIIDEYGTPAHKIVVNPAAAAPEFGIVTDQVVLCTAQERYGVPETFVMAVGNLEPRKNLLRLIRAFAEVIKLSSVAAKLVLVGKTHWKGSAVGEEIRRLNLTEHVVLTGYVPQDDLVTLYNLATVFAYPSLYEGFGLPILEAMACSTPVITSHVASMPEVAGDAALLIDPRSETELAEALRQVLTDPALRTRLKQAGLAQAARFSWEQTARTILKACVEPVSA